MTALVQVGMLRTAASLFQDLGLYKEMVECYIAMDEEQDAEKIVKEQVLTRNKWPYDSHMQKTQTHMHRRMHRFSRARHAACTHAACAHAACTQEKIWACICAKLNVLGWMFWAECLGLDVLG